MDGDQSQIMVDESRLPPRPPKPEGLHWYSTPLTLTDILIPQLLHAQRIGWVLVPFSLLSHIWPWVSVFAVNYPSFTPFLQLLSQTQLAEVVCESVQKITGQGYTTGTPPTLALPLTRASSPSVIFLGWYQESCTCNFAVCKTAKLRRHPRSHVWSRASSRAYADLILTPGKTEASNIISTMQIESCWTWRSRGLQCGVVWFSDNQPGLYD